MEVIRIYHYDETIVGDYYPVYSSFVNTDKHPRTGGIFSADDYGITGQTLRLSSPYISSCKHGIALLKYP